MWIRAEGLLCADATCQPAPIDGTHAALAVCRLHHRAAGRPRTPTGVLASDSHHQGSYLVYNFGGHPMPRSSTRWSLVQNGFPTAI